MFDFNASELPQIFRSDTVVAAIAPARSHVKPKEAGTT
jgi:hypothetical protein